MEEEKENLQGQNEGKIQEVQEKMQEELTERQDELEKKHAYRLEQMRQEVTEKHEQVIMGNFTHGAERPRYISGFSRRRSMAA